MIVGAAYAVFSGVYWVLGGIYPNGRRYDLSIVDFDSNQLLAIGTLFVFVFGVIFLAFLFDVFLSHLNGWFRTYCLPERSIYMKGIDYSLITSEDTTKYNNYNNNNNNNRQQVVYSADDIAVYPSSSSDYYPVNYY
jgi:hypothetical protein